MDLTYAGLAGAAIGTAIGAANYVILVPFVEKRLRAIDRSQSAQERADFESKLGIFRRLVLTFDLVGFGAIGYWLGKLAGSYA
jgi:predicted DNA-binding transcriptional regulator